MHVLRIFQIGDDLAIPLPAEVAAALEVQAGDEICLTRAPGGYRLNKGTVEFKQAMAIGEAVMEKNRDVLRALGDDNSPGDTSLLKGFKPPA